MLSKDLVSIAIPVQQIVAGIVRQSPKISDHSRITINHIGPWHTNVRHAACDNRDMSRYDIKQEGSITIDNVAIRPAIKDVVGT